MPRSVTFQESSRPATCVLHVGAATASGGERVSWWSCPARSTADTWPARLAKAACASSSGKGASPELRLGKMRSSANSLPKSHVGVFKQSPGYEGCFTKTGRPLRLRGECCAVWQFSWSSKASKYLGKRSRSWRCSCNSCFCFCECVSSISHPGTLL